MANVRVVYQPEVGQVVDTADLAAWLATDAGRAAIRAGVDARLRALTAAVRAQPTYQSVNVNGDDVTHYEAGLALLCVVNALEALTAAPREPAQEPAAGARRETPHSGPEFGWVIERGDTPVFAPLYFAFHQHAGGDLNDDPPNGWLWDFDNLKAARFARREDAEKFWTCAIGRDRDEVRVAEHGWGTPPAAPDPLLPGLRAARELWETWCLSNDAPESFEPVLDAEIARRGGA